MLVADSATPHPSTPRVDTFSLRFGHAAGLTVPRTVIQYRVAASLPKFREKAEVCADFTIGATDFVQSKNFVFIYLLNKIIALNDIR